MNIDDMRKAIALDGEARQLKRKFDGWVLIRKDSFTKPEVVNIGEPATFASNQYHRMEIVISDDLRRIAFRRWRKGIALKFNDVVRQLNQIGVDTDLELIEFSSVTGEPL